MANYVNSVKRIGLPALHFQLDHHFPPMATHATPSNGREPDDFQPRAQIKRLIEEREPVSGDSEAIRKFSDKYIDPKSL